MSNGLVKVAMYEHMATLFGGLPNAHHLALYNLWSQGGWGMIITGNVQVSRDHLTLGKDMVVPETITPDTLHSYKTLARVMRPVSERNLSKNRDNVSMPRTLIIMQVSHTGRQSPILLGGRSLFVPPHAPSAFGLGRNASNWFARLMYRIAFLTPRTMSMQDIDNVVNRFVLSANLAHDAGFDGIELHASHGYLLAQFISPKTNIRDDAYGASHAPLYLLQRIVTSIRAVLPRPFVLGVKLSSSDYIGAGSVHDPRAEEEAEDRAVAHVVEVSLWDMIDFIEVSGGDYENPDASSIPSFESPSLLRSLCAQSAIRHPWTDILLATTIGSTHRGNAVSRHFPRRTYPRTCRPCRHRPRERASSRLTVASQGVLRTPTNGNPGRIWRRKKYGSRFSIQATNIVLHGDAVHPCSGIYPSFAGHPSSSKSNRSWHGDGLVHRHDEEYLQGPES